MRARLAAMVLFVCVLSSATSHADVGKEVAVAVAPVATTALGIAMLYVGGNSENAILVQAGVATVVMGPSLGRFMVGEPWSLGLKLRLGGATAVGVALLRIVFADGMATDGFFLGVAGAAAFVVGAGCDFVSAPIIAHEQAQAKVTMVVPIATSSSAGLAVLGTF